jgi:hypothetical protein
MSISVNKIKDIEKKYMEKIMLILSESDFFQELDVIEKTIIENKDAWSNFYAKTNLIDIAIERLLRFIFYKHLAVEIKNIYSSPISCDLAFIMDDCILNIDSKTVNIHSNYSDVNPGLIENNQVSFTNTPLLKRGLFKGYPFTGRLNAYEKISDNELPVICYFIKISYHDKSKKECHKFCINDSYYINNSIQLYSVPNKYIADEEYKNDLINGFKTYKYVDKEEAKKYSKYFMPKNNVEAHWKKFHTIASNGTKTKRWLDNKENPFNPNAQCIWGKCGGKYKLISGGKTFRIKRGKLEKRKDSDGNYWTGYIDIS